MISLSSVASPLWIFSLFFYVSTSVYGWNFLLCSSLISLQSSTLIIIENQVCSAIKSEKHPYPSTYLNSPFRSHFPSLPPQHSISWKRTKILFPLIKIIKYFFIPVLSFNTQIKKISFQPINISNDFYRLFNSLSSTLSPLTPSLAVCFEINVGLKRHYVYFLASSTIFLFFLVSSFFCCQLSLSSRYSCKVLFLVLVLICGWNEQLLNYYCYCFFFQTSLNFLFLYFSSCRSSALSQMGSSVSRLPLRMVGMG